MSKGLRLGESTTTTSGDRSGCKPDPLLLQAPNLGKPRARDSPGTGRGFQAPPKVRAASRAGNPARAPKRGAAAGKSGEKNFCFFFFFFRFSGTHAPQAPSSWPHVGQPPHGRPAHSAPPANRLSWVPQWVGLTAAKALKGAAGRGGSRSLTRRTRALVSPNPGLFLLRLRSFPPSFVGQISLSSEHSGSVGRFGALRPRSLHFLPRDWRGLFFTVDYNCNMTLEELVACDNAAQK